MDTSGGVGSRHCSADSRSEMGGTLGNGTSRLVGIDGGRMHCRVDKRLMTARGATGVGRRESKECWHLCHRPAKALHQWLNQVGHAH